MFAVTTRTPTKTSHPPPKTNDAIGNQFFRCCNQSRRQKPFQRLTRSRGARFVTIDFLIVDIVLRSHEFDLHRANVKKTVVSAALATAMRDTARRGVTRR